MTTGGANKDDSWVIYAMGDAWKKVRPILAQRQQVIQLQKYKLDPSGFIREILGEKLTPDQEKVVESVRDNTVTVAKSANGVGKSWLAARLALWMFCCYEDSEVYMTAAPPEQNLKNILWAELMHAVNKRPTIISGFRKMSDQIIRHEKSFITTVAIPTTGSSSDREAKFSGKHAPSMMFIVDEGDAVPEEIYRGIDGCMSGGNFVRMLIMFNPRAKIGPVYAKESQGYANVVEISSLRHPNVIDGYSVFPGAVTRETVIRRIYSWTRELMRGEPITDDCVEIPEFLTGQEVVGLDGKIYPPIQQGYRKVTEPAFFYMVLGRYPPQGTAQLISETWIDNARARWDAYVSVHGEMPPEGVHPIMGLDLAEYGSDYNTACLRYGGFVSRIHTWAGMDVDASAQKALEIYLEKGCRIVHVDATGIGSGVAPSMARKGRDHDVRAVGVKVSGKPSPTFKTDLGEFKILRDQLWWSVREWLKNDPGAMLPPDPLLIEELKSISYEIGNDGKIRVTDKESMRNIMKRSPDRADSLCLTFSPFERARFLVLRNN